MQERVLYKSRCTKSVEHPEEYMSIILDGMNTCNVPLKMPMAKGIHIFWKKLSSKYFFIFFGRNFLPNFFLFFFGRNFLPNFLEPFFYLQFQVLQDCQD